MILIDSNILLYAQDSSSQRFAAARGWLDEQLSGTDPVALCWPVIAAFFRIGTNPRITERPLSTREAIQTVQSWFEQPCVRLIQPTERHWTILQEMLTRGQATGNLVTDARLAALALEHNCVLHSTDADFARFPKLKWKNPLAD